MAGQEGFEPPTPGFGVRRSAVRASGLNITEYSAQNKELRLLKQETCVLLPVFLVLLLCLCLFMLNMLSTMLTIFLEIKLLSGILFVFGCRIIFILAVSTL